MAASGAPVFDTGALRDCTRRRVGELCGANLGKNGSMSRHTDEVFSRLPRPNTTGRTEADIQSDIRLLLLGPHFNLDTPRLEEPLGDGTRRRIDVAVGATVIEAKKVLETEETAQDDIDQLAGYVRTRTQQEQSRYNGILTNGRSWWLYEADPSTGEFKRRSSFTLNKPDQGSRLVEWLQAVLATHSNLRPTRRTIEANIGASSPAYEQDSAYLKALYSQLESDPTVRLKRELWARLLRSALGAGFEDRDDLFSDHTLLVLEAMAIGHAVMGIPLSEISGKPQEFMSGAAFDNAGIHGLLEAGFFDWLLAADVDGERFIARVIRRISVFDWSNVEHDVLKILYESIINADTRKGLGEYYTPDWLAEGIVEEAVTAPLTQKVLDPSCGSGTFLFHAVRRISAAADEAGWENAKTIDHVQKHVFGLDIHPVSIVLARITYLLALGERLSHDRGDVWVPVHLGDSIQWFQPVDSESDEIRIDTRSSDLTVPDDGGGVLFDLANVLVFPLASIDDAGTFDRLVTDLTDLAKTHTDINASRPNPNWVLRKYAIPTQSGDAETLRDTFKLLADLHAEGKDSVWSYFVRNQVRPLWLSMPNRQVDVLVGNPPWVAYRYMTESMQQKFRALSEDRNLWHGKKLATHQDLVGLFIVRAAEKYLKNKGTFGFVTPLALLSRQQYEGFRAGKWGPNLRGTVNKMWDLKDVRPTGDLFPVPAAVIFGHRDYRYTGPEHPDVPYGTVPNKFVIAGLRDTSGWDASRTALTFTETPNRALSSTDTDPVSPYSGSPTQGAAITPRMLFFITEENAVGRLGMSAGRVNYRSKRTSQEKLPWKQLLDLSGVIDQRFIFDVHLGSTIAPFRPLKPWRAILPIERDLLLSDQQIDSGERSLVDWWRQATDVWETNRQRTTKLSLRESLNYQSKMTKQLGAPTHRVVYSASGNTIAAARLTNTRQVVEHALYWMPARNENEARYLTAVLNATATTEAVAEYQSQGLFGARHFDNYIWKLPIPIYDGGDALHLRIVALAAAAESVATATDVGNASFQKARAIIRDALGEAGIKDDLDTAVAELFAE